MPRLMVFAPCKIALNDPSLGNTVSMIAILGGLDVPVSVEHSDLPADAASPIEWAIVTIWRSLPDDNGAMFEQRTIVRKPDASIFAEVTQPLPTNEFSATNSVRLPVFPIGREGFVSITVEIRELAEGNEWHFMGDYPIRLRYAPMPDGESATDQQAT